MYFGRDKSNSKSFGADYFCDSLRTGSFNNILIEYFLAKDLVNWFLIVFFTVHWLSIPLLLSWLIAIFSL